MLRLSSIEPNKYFKWNSNIPKQPITSQSVNSLTILNYINDWLENNKYLPSGFEINKIPDYQFLVDVYLHIDPADSLGV